MSDQPRNLTLERVNRLQQSVADLMEAQTAQTRQFTRMMSQIVGQLEAIHAEQVRTTKAITDLTSDQILPGNRVEEAFSRALRTNIRLDDIEDRHGV